MRSHISDSSQRRIAKRKDARLTCMTSRSCTYLRSVSTISLIILFRAASCAFGATVTFKAWFARESIDSCDASRGGDIGGGSKISEGKRSTRVVTVLTTYGMSRMGIDGDNERLRTFTKPSVE